MLVFSQFGTLINYLLIAVAPSIWLVYVARMVDGITAGNFSVAQAYIQRPYQRARSRHIGLWDHQLCLPSGLSIGPAIGGLVAASFGPRVAYGLGACMSFGTILLTALLLKESLPPERRTHHIGSGNAVPVSALTLMRRPAVSILLIVFSGQFSFFFCPDNLCAVGEAVLPTSQPMRSAAG